MLQLENEIKSNKNMPVLIDDNDENTFNVFFGPQENAENGIYVWDVFAKKKVDLEMTVNFFIAKSDYVQAVLDPDFYVKQITKITENRVVLVGNKLSEKMSKKEEIEKIKKEELAKFLKECRPSEYLARTLYPILGPALAIVERERPEDPMAFLATYLLQNKGKRVFFE